MTEAYLEELSLDECLRLLREREIGRIAALVDGWPLVLPVTYRLVETSGLTWIAFRTRPGNVIDRAPTAVAFEIDEIDRRAQEGWSVLARGTLHAVDTAIAEFEERFDPEPWLLVARDSWRIIQPFLITGRRLVAGRGEWVFGEPL